MNTITALLAKKMEECGMSLEALVKRLGYMDFNQGLMELVDVIKEGKVNSIIEKKLSDIFGFDFCALKEMAKKLDDKKTNKRDMIAKKRKKSNNVLSVVFKKREKDLFDDDKVVCIIASLDEINAFEWIDKLHFIRGLIYSHYDKNNSFISGNGYEISGYVFTMLKNGKTDEKIYFNHEGSVKKVITNNFPKIISALSVLNKSTNTELSFA